MGTVNRPGPEERLRDVSGPADPRFESRSDSLCLVVCVNARTFEDFLVSWCFKPSQSQRITSGPNFEEERIKRRLIAPSQAECGSWERGKSQENG